MEKRISDLVGSGMIQRTGAGLAVTRRGRPVGAFFRVAHPSCAPHPPPERPNTPSAVPWLGVGVVLTDRSLTAKTAARRPKRVRRSINEPEPARVASDQIAGKSSCNLRSISVARIFEPISVKWESSHAIS